MIHKPEKQSSPTHSDRASVLECGAPVPLFGDTTTMKSGAGILRDSSALPESAAGAAHSKTWRNILAAFCLNETLGAPFELEYRT